MKTLVCLILSPLLVLALPATLGAQAIPIFVSGQDRDYVPLSQEDFTLITVRGPGELRLISRPRFRPDAGETHRFGLVVRVNGGAAQEIVYEDVERSTTAMFRDGRLGVPGRLVDYTLRLARGYHNIEVRAAQASPQIYFRHLFKPKRERRRSWVPLTPLRTPELVELVVRETLVPYYRNAAGEGFTLDVIGPTELRIFTRLENTPEMRGRIHYRLQIQQDGQVVNTYQLGSRRSEVAQYHREDALVPGRAVEVVVAVPEGKHRYELRSIDPDKPTFLARFMLPREDLSLTAD
ncbi:MAG: hypothetical protein AAGN66_21565 [Acidobacteriota bacterium]